MKHASHFKRSVATMLSVLMVFGAVPPNVYAESDVDEPVAIETVVQEESESDIETVEVATEPETQAETSEATEREVAETSEAAQSVEADVGEESEPVAVEETETEAPETTEAAEDATAPEPTEAQQTEATEAETAESATEAPVEEEAKPLFSSIAEDSVISEDALNGIDFSSKRLLVAGDESLIIDKENILSSYDGVFLLQYQDATTAKYAYSYYYGKAAFVDVDSIVSVATGNGGAVGSAEMSDQSNPIGELEDAVSEHPGTTSSGVIAVIDTGVNGFEGNVVESVSMLGSDTSDSNGHGTRMAELIVSANPNAKIISIKALGANGTGDASAVYAAIQYAKSRGVSIINLSISAPKKAENAAIATAIAEAQAQGIKVVAAAGNQGNNASYYIPGGLDGVITIGAAGADGVRLPSSNYGSAVEYNVVAPSTSEAAATYSGLLSAGKGEIDNVLVFQTNYEALEEDEWVSRSVEEIDASVGYTGDHSGFSAQSTTSTHTITGTGGYYAWMNGSGHAFVSDDGSEAFCILPWSKAPMNDTMQFVDYDTKDITNNRNLQIMAKLMYYGWAGGGNIFSTWKGGAYAEAIAQQAITHFAMSYHWMNVMGNSHGGPNWYVTGRDGVSGLNATGRQITMEYYNYVLGLPDVKGTLHIAEYYQQSGHSYQDIAYGNFEGAPKTAKLTIEKTSANPEVTDGNDRYDMTGIQYTAYTNSSCTTVAKDKNGKQAIFTLNKDGSAKETYEFTVEENGTPFYIKETYVPKNSGYVLNNEVYNQTLKPEAEGSKGVTLAVKDSGGTKDVKIQKLSEKQDATNDNPCYNMEGIVYRVYTDANCQTRAKDADGNLIELTLDKNGASNAVTVPYGDYYIKEYSVPNGSGYILSNKVSDKQSITVDSPEVTTVTMTDPPKMDPIGLLLLKVDKKTGKDVRRVEL